MTGKVQTDVMAPLPEEAIATACRLVGRGRARSVRVVVGRRLTYDELVRCRAWAAAAAVNMAMDGDGVVTIRAREVAGTGAEARLIRPGRSWARWLCPRDDSPTLERLRARKGMR